MTIQYLKLEIFIPATHFRILQKALQSVDARAYRKTMTAAFLTVPSREHGVLWKERLLTSAKKMKSVKKKSIKWKSP